MAHNVYKIIAGYKIDTIAEELTRSFKTKISKVEKQMTEGAKEVFLAKIPKDILEFWGKYPELLKKSYQFSFQLDGKKGWDYRQYVGMVIPDYEIKYTDTLKDSPKLAAKLSKLAHKRIALRFEERQTVNQIKCALSKLRTYKKIEANFPEAYKILIEKIDKVEVKTEPSTLCDDVEKLRAKLAPKVKED